MTWRCSTRDSLNQCRRKWRVFLKHPHNFWKKVEKSEYGCWLWRGLVMPDGYGQVQMKGARARVAHRVAYEEIKGAIPEGLVLDHLCRVRHCVNPAHLEPVTLAENTARGIGITVKNSLKRFCKRGHPFTEENTYRKGSHRGCKACRMASERAKYGERRKANPLPKVWRYNSLKTHCKNGHEFNEENTHNYVYQGRTHRCCRVCAREKMRRRVIAKRATAAA